MAPPYEVLTKYGRGDQIRTCDPWHPMQVLYQAELHPDNVLHIISRNIKIQFFFYLVHSMHTAWSQPLPSQG